MKELVGNATEIVKNSLVPFNNVADFIKDDRAVIPIARREREMELRVFANSKDTVVFVDET